MGPQARTTYRLPSLKRWAHEQKTSCQKSSSAASQPETSLKLFHINFMQLCPPIYDTLIILHMVLFEINKGCLLCPSKFYIPPCRAANALQGSIFGKFGNLLTPIFPMFVNDNSQARHALALLVPEDRQFMIRGVQKIHWFLVLWDRYKHLTHLRLWILPRLQEYRTQPRDVCLRIFVALIIQSALIANRRW